MRIKKIFLSRLRIRSRACPWGCFPFLIFCLLPAISPAQSSKNVRVAVVQDTSGFRLKIEGAYEIVNLLNQETVYKGNNLNTTVTAYNDKIFFGSIMIKDQKVLIKTADNVNEVVDGRRFRGNLKLIRKDNSHLLVVNEINLEDYIKGILYHEVSHYWPMEALKAQAIVCRTYALYQMQENAGRDYDVTSDIYSQVYGGVGSERYRTTKAVIDTAGRILVYQGKVIPAFYSATCAGNTENVSLLWNIDLLPLKGITCNFCKESPHFNWHAVLTLGEIEEKIGSGLVDIKDIVILGRDTSGRISDLNIISAKKALKISAKDFRNQIDPNIIRSTNFNIQVINHDAVFEGIGWGHGVGLCQWGAYFMAKQGSAYEQILQYYYPGTEIKNE